MKVTLAFDVEVKDSDHCSMDCPELHWGPGGIPYCDLFYGHGQYISVRSNNLERTSRCRKANQINCSGPLQRVGAQGLLCLKPFPY